jgi:hypothetical protein
MTVLHVLFIMGGTSLDGKLKGLYNVHSHGDCKRGGGGLGKM